MPLDLLEVWKKRVTHPVPGSTSKRPETIQVAEKLVHWVEVIKTDEMGWGKVR